MTGGLAWFCNNPDCPALGDDTPTNGPNSDNCLMCNKPHVWVELESAVNHRNIRTIVLAVHNKVPSQQH